MTTIKPMLCQSANKPFNKKGWRFEPKLDGSRALAIVTKGKVTIQSRDGRDVTHVYPEVVAALKDLNDVILDGEVVALDEQGRPNFNLLQQRSSMNKELGIRSRMANIPVVFYAFDILYCSKNLSDLKLSERLAILERLLGSRKNPTLRLVTGVEEKGEDLWNAVTKMDMEGIVAKDLNSKYKQGTRSPSWVKVKKVETSDFVVIGYTQGTGYRAKTFGALVLGTYQKDGSISHVGEVGSGLTDRNIETIWNSFKRTGRQYNQDGEMVTEVEPNIVVEVKFMERTATGALRQPVFMRLRYDKKPKECA